MARRTTTDVHWCRWILAVCAIVINLDHVSAQIEIPRIFSEDLSLSHNIYSYPLPDSLRNQAADLTIGLDPARLLLAQTLLEEGGERVPAMMRYDFSSESWVRFTDESEQSYGSIVVFGSYNGFLVLWLDAGHAGQLRAATVSKEGSRTDIELPSGTQFMPREVLRFRYPDRVGIMFAGNPEHAYFFLDSNAMPIGDVQTFVGGFPESRGWMSDGRGGHRFMTGDDQALLLDSTGTISTEDIALRLPGDDLADGSYYIDGQEILIQRGDSLHRYGSFADTVPSWSLPLEIPESVIGQKVQIHRDSVGYLLIGGLPVRDFGYYGVEIMLYRLDSVTGAVSEISSLDRTGTNADSQPADIKRMNVGLVGRDLDNTVIVAVSATVQVSQSFGKLGWTFTGEAEAALGPDGKPTRSGAFAAIDMPSRVTATDWERNPIRLLAVPWWGGHAFEYALPVAPVVISVSAASPNLGHSGGVGTARWIKGDSIETVTLLQLLNRDVRGASIPLPDPNRMVARSSRVGPILLYDRTYTKRYNRSGYFDYRYSYRFSLLEGLGQTLDEIELEDHSYETPAGEKAPQVILYEEAPIERETHLLIYYPERDPFYRLISFNGSDRSVGRVDWHGQREPPTDVVDVSLNSDTALLLTANGRGVHLPGSKEFVLSEYKESETLFLKGLSNYRVLCGRRHDDGRTEMLLYNFDGLVIRRSMVGELDRRDYTVVERASDGGILLTWSDSTGTYYRVFDAELADGWLGSEIIGTQRLVATTDGIRESVSMLFGDTLVGLFRRARSGSTHGMFANMVSIPTLFRSVPEDEKTPEPNISRVAAEVTPNPGYRTRTIRFESPVDATGRMTLVNAVGETVLDQRVQVKSGANSIELDLSFLVSGHYQFLLESSEFASSASIIHYAE